MANITLNAKVRGNASTNDGLLFQEGVTTAGVHKSINIQAGIADNDFIPTLGKVVDIIDDRFDGISGGQTLAGGDSASENLTLSSTSDTTKGSIISDSQIKIIDNNTIVNKDVSNNLTLTDINVGTKTLAGLSTQWLNWFIPMDGVTDTQFPLFGAHALVSAGETANYATTFSGNNQHLFILVNSITTGGNIVITGTSISEVTGLPVTADTETITVDTSTNQNYQTYKHWLEVTNIDVSATVGINYDLGKLGYLDGGNNPVRVLGYRADIRVTGRAADLRIRGRKVQNDGGNKFSFVAFEDFGFDSSVGGGQYYDHLRTGGNDRSYTMSVTLAETDTELTLSQLDFATYFLADENFFDGSNNEGMIIDFLGEPSGGISSIDHVTLSVLVLK